MDEKKNKHDKNDQNADEKTCKKHSECEDNKKTCDKQCNKHEDKLKELEEKLKLQQEINSKLEKELEECKSKSAQYLSTAAYYKNEAETNKKDFERFKERNKQIESDAKTSASEIMAKKLLPILDSFDQAISQVDAEVMRGFAMIYSSMQNILSELGVEEINCKDSMLDPKLHNCINTEATDNKKLDGKIALVYQKGYKFAGSGAVIRPATVSVYKLS